MMFIFLPLIAAVLSVLYIRSGRYYVEHLLFVVHFHAFFFLAGLIVLLFELLAESSPDRSRVGITAIQAALGTALAIYVPLYLLKAMRRVYGQGWWKTVLKFTLLGFAYFVSLIFTGLGLLAYTALTLCRLRSRIAARAHPGAGQVRVRELPVEQLVDDRRHEVCAPVLVVEIVRVLPDVDREDRRETHASAACRRCRS